MQTKTLPLAGVAASVALAVALSVATASSVALVLTPVTVAIYLVVGVAVPQYLVSRRTGSPTSLGLAAFAAVGGVASLVVGGLTVGPLEPWGSWVFALLALVVAGTFLGSVGRALRAGYRDGRGA